MSRLSTAINSRISTLREHPDGFVWTSRSNELATAASRLVNRSDACGGYRDGHGTTHKAEYTNTWHPMPDALRLHFQGDRIIGLHTTNPHTNTCKWMAFDLDAHDAATDANMKPALLLAKRIKSAGLRPYIFDSNGKGGLHVWCMFPRPRKTHRVYALARQLSEGIDCEAFPKQDHVEPGRFGNWLRLPGKHWKRNHWTRLLAPAGWASADETIDAICEMCQIKRTPAA